MKRLSKILGTNWYFVLIIPMLLCSHTLLAVMAWQGDHFALACIIALWFFWTVLALFVQRGWHATLRNSASTLDGWKETTNLLKDFAMLLQEATDELSTWDREKSDDIQARMATISVMRTQNIHERLMHDPTWRRRHRR